ncbi:MAG: hypothetical protein RLZ63_1604 [Pseudomonadota bacterium]
MTARLDMVPLAGIGPATSPLPRECSTTEPQGRNFQMTTRQLERETGIEPASLAWKAKVLPLNYSRIDRSFAKTTGANARKPFPNALVVRQSRVRWWRRLDSNQRRRKPTDLQSAPFSHSGTPPGSEPQIMPPFWRLAQATRNFFTKRPRPGCCSEESRWPAQSGHIR